MYCLEVCKMMRCQVGNSVFEKHPTARHKGIHNPFSLPTFWLQWVICIESFLEAANKVYYSHFLWRILTSVYRGAGVAFSQTYQFEKIIAQLKSRPCHYPVWWLVCYCFMACNQPFSECMPDSKLVSWMWDQYNRKVGPPTICCAQNFNRPSILHGVLKIAQKW